MRLASLAAMICPAVFFSVMMILGQVTPDYDWVARFGSELALGRYGTVMIANFLVLGLAVAGLAAVLWRVSGTQRSGKLAAAALGAAGVAFGVAGAFVTDPAGKIHTVHGMLHLGAALVLFFAAIPTAGLAIARRYRTSGLLARYSAVTGLATPLLFVATLLSGHAVALYRGALSTSAGDDRAG